MLVSCSLISGLLFGYDTGVLSGAFVTCGTDLHGGTFELTNGQKEFMTSTTTLGALIGGLVEGVLSDRTGRKPVFDIVDIVFIRGAIAQAVCHDVWSMVCLSTRFFFQLANTPIDLRPFPPWYRYDLASCVSPLYIQELSPTPLWGETGAANTSNSFISPSTFATPMNPSSFSLSIKLFTQGEHSPKPLSFCGTTTVCATSNKVPQAISPLIFRRLVMNMLPSIFLSPQLKGPIWDALRSIRI
ncbi:hypothetical protein E1B28_006720 [Marasmius oreades]|uniref:Major facilitator superfamily (MFS) profile domain-containing protein n=1 Tax=Marasmius oreades TaxID=181124 RepID=A0A9P7UWP3_9AGAR|nr:uncharacterized protein E1B28_006720 [Marasmius oreades]KAG7096039.1 hypothetical protein E1B28_006720 [Marasmius oreades]